MVTHHLKNGWLFNWLALHGVTIKDDSPHGQIHTAFAIVGRFSPTKGVVQWMGSQRSQAAEQIHPQALVNNPSCDDHCAFLRINMTWVCVKP